MANLQTTQAAIKRAYRINPYIISKWFDPIFGATVGLLAYYAYEKRHGRPEGQYLNQLLYRKIQRVFGKE